MTLSKRIASVIGATALAAGALAGVTTVATAAPAQAATCSTGVPGYWSVYNSTCSQARHFNIISGKTYRYAAWVGKARTSAQSVCWANMTHYGVQVA